MPHLIKLDLFDVKGDRRLRRLAGTLAHPAIHRDPGDLEQAGNDAITSAPHAVEEEGKSFFGSRFAPRRGAGKLVATIAGLALPALDCLNMAIFAGLWRGTLGTGWPCV
jgi:hypothetical protein